MRLINADELKYCHIVKAVIGPMGSAMLKEVDINDIPTAFDLKSVIEQLKKTAIEELGITKEMFSMDEGECSSYCSLSFCDVIEILKSATNVTNGKNGGLENGG